MNYPSHGARFSVDELEKWFLEQEQKILKQGIGNEK